eukprot:674376_1
MACQLGIEDSIPPAFTFRRLSDIPAGLKCRFVLYLSASMSGRFAEISLISVEMLESWGIQRIAVLEHPVGTVVGTGLLITGTNQPGRLEMTCLCHNSRNSVFIERILECLAAESIEHLSEFTTFVDVARNDRTFQGFLRKVGFVNDREPHTIGREWCRFVLRPSVDELKPIRSEPATRSESTNNVTRRSDQITASTSLKPTKETIPDSTAKIVPTETSNSILSAKRPPDCLPSHSAKRPKTDSSVSREMTLPVDHPTSG